MEIGDLLRVRACELCAQELFCCQGLRKLTLSDNDIATLPPAIAALVNLEFLDLSKNCTLLFTASFSS